MSGKKREVKGYIRSINNPDETRVGELVLRAF
jgi:hypothetical protein